MRYSPANLNPGKGLESASCIVNVVPLILKILALPSVSKHRKALAEMCLMLQMLYTPLSNVNRMLIGFFLLNFEIHFSHNSSKFILSRILQSPKTFADQTFSTVVRKSEMNPQSSILTKIVSWANPTTISFFFKPIFFIQTTF